MFRRFASPGHGSPTPSSGETSVFRIVTGHSHKGYSEVVYRQTVEDFIRYLSPNGAQYTSPGQRPGIEREIFAKP